MATTTPAQPAQSVRTRSKVRTALRWASVTWASVMTAGLIAILAVRLLGGQINVVATGSMRPVLQEGSLAVSVPVDSDAVEAGDIISFWNRDDQLVMHRVVEILDHNGVRRFRTQGDANLRTDPQLIHEERVEQQLIGWVPKVGVVVANLGTTIGFGALFLMLSPLLVWALGTGPQTPRPRREQPAPETIPPAQPSPFVPDEAGLCPRWLT